MIFLEEIPEIGNLYIEKVLFEFDKVPMVFICQNLKKDRFLCLCTDCITGYSWMIAKIERRTLIKLINDKISILNAIKETKNKIYIVNKEKGEYTYSKYNFKDIPLDELPDENEKLENHFLKEYIYQLEFEETISGVVWNSNSLSRKFFVFPQNVPIESLKVKMNPIIKNRPKNKLRYETEVIITPMPSGMNISYCCEKEIAQREQYMIPDCCQTKCMSI